MEFIESANKEYIIKLLEEHDPARYIFNSNELGRNMIFFNHTSNTTVVSPTLFFIFNIRSNIQS